MTHRVRRTPLGPAVAAALALALTAAGCGTVRTDRAAVVDGTVITQTAVQDATAEINGMDPALLQDRLSPAGTLTALIQAPPVLDYLADQGVVVSDTVALEEASARGVREPSEATLEIIRFANALQQAQERGVLGEAQGAELTAQLAALDVEVNPRYGEFDPETASIDPTLPGWVTLYESPGPEPSATPQP